MKKINSSLLRMACGLFFSLLLSTVGTRATADFQDAEQFPPLSVAHLFAGPHGEVAGLTAEPAILFTWDEDGYHVVTVLEEPPDAIAVSSRGFLVARGARLLHLDHEGHTLARWHFQDPIRGLAHRGEETVLLTASGTLYTGNAHAGEEGFWQEEALTFTVGGQVFFLFTDDSLYLAANVDEEGIAYGLLYQRQTTGDWVRFDFTYPDFDPVHGPYDRISSPLEHAGWAGLWDDAEHGPLLMDTATVVFVVDSEKEHYQLRGTLLQLHRDQSGWQLTPGTRGDISFYRRDGLLQRVAPHPAVKPELSRANIGFDNYQLTATTRIDEDLAIAFLSRDGLPYLVRAPVTAITAKAFMQNQLPELLGLPNRLIQVDLMEKPFPEPVRIRSLGSRIAAIDSEGNLYLARGREPFQKARHNQLSKAGLKDIALADGRIIAHYPERLEFVPENLSGGAFANLERNAHLYEPYTFFVYNQRNRVLADGKGRYYFGGHTSISAPQHLPGAARVSHVLAGGDSFFLLGHTDNGSTISPRIWEVTGYGSANRTEISIPGHVTGGLRGGYYNPETGILAVGDRGLIALRDPTGGWRFRQILNEPNLSFAHVVDGRYVVGGPHEGIFFSDDGDEWHRIEGFAPHAWQHLEHSAGVHFLLDAFGRRLRFGPSYFSESNPTPVYPLRQEPTPLTVEERFYALCVEFEKIMAGTETWEELQARAIPIFSRFRDLSRDMGRAQYQRLIMPFIERFLAYGRGGGNLVMVGYLFPTFGEHRETQQQWINSLPPQEQNELRSWAQAVVDRRVTSTPGDPSLKPKPAENPARFDLDRVIERAYRGNKGAMIDLMYALNNSWGIAKDPRTSRFWYNRAGSVFVFPENATPEQRAEVEQRMADAGSIYWDNILLNRNLPRTDDPAYADAIQKRLRLARSGNYGALDSIISGWIAGRVTLDLQEARALLDHYLPGNPDKFLEQKITLMQQGLFGEPVNYHALRRLLEDFAPLDRPKRYGESYFSSVLGDLLLAGLGGPADPERAALHHAYNERLLPGRVFSKPVLPALTDLDALRSRARAGDPIAKFDLASVYRSGTGIPRNERIGRRLERESKEAGGPEHKPHINLRRQLEAGRELAALGSLTGSNLLAEAAARLAEETGNFAEYRPTVETLAGEGARTARRVLAHWAQNGTAESPPDHAAARRLLAGLALEGDPWARSVIASNWRVPDSIPQSTLAQWAWEQRRNDRHFGIRDQTVGGIGIIFVEPYLDLENRTVAAEAGDAGAMWDLAIVYNSKAFRAGDAGETETRRRYAELAQDWFERYLLADGTESGDVGGREAHRSYLNEQLGSVVAPFKLARSLLRDEPSTEDQVRAMELLQRAALRGNFGASLELGKFHSQGQHGLTQNWDEAKKWLELALPSDHPAVLREYAFTLANINGEDRAAFRPYFARAFSKGSYASAYDMVISLPQLEAGGSIEAAAWLLGASGLEPELVAPHVAVQRIHAAAVGGNRDAMSAWARILKQSLGLRAIDRAAAAGWGQLAKVDNGQPAPQLRWAESWLREGLTDEQWAEATNLTPERIAALKSAPLERIHIPWQQELERGEGPARNFYNQIRNWTGIGRQVHRQLVESGYPLAFRQEVVDAAYERTDFPTGHPWFLRLIGDAEPVADNAAAEERLQKAVLAPRDTPEAEARFGTALAATLFRLWFGVDRPADRAAAAAWARVRSGGSREEALTEAFYAILTDAQRASADALFDRISGQLPGGVPTWKPATVYDLIPELTVESGKSVAGGE